MILIDTNVISEVVRAAPDPRVVRWMQAQPRATLVTSVVVRAEILFGLALMPDGAPRRQCTALATAVLATIGTVLPVTEAAATLYAEIAAERRRAGRPLQAFDGLIAATARAVGAAVATRNVGDFDGCGVVLVDPWAA